MNKWTDQGVDVGEEPGGMSFDMAAPDKGGPAHALAGPARARGRDMPGLQQLAERQAREMRACLEPLLRRPPPITADEVVREPFGDYVRRMRGPLMSVTLLDLSPCSGRAMLVMEPNLVLHMIDLFFGGNGVVPAALPPEFSPTGLALIDRATTRINEVLARSWTPFGVIGFRTCGHESNPRMLNHVAADEMVVVTRFVLTLADGRCTPIDIVYPMQSLRPFMASLGPPPSPAKAAGDPKWRGGLTRAVMDVTLEVRIVLSEPVMPLSRLANLRPGDVIPLELTPDVHVLVSGRRFARATVGQSGTKAAIRLEQIEPFSHDEDHQ